MFDLVAYPQYRLELGSNWFAQGELDHREEYMSLLLSHPAGASIDERYYMVWMVRPVCG